MREGWVFLAVIAELFSRRVVGRAVRNRMNQDLALPALNMAIRYLAADVYIRERGDPQAAPRLHSSLGSRIAVTTPIA
jgi:transposase InsO family protein